MKEQAGMTLIEITLSIALLAIISSVVFGTNVDVFRRYTFIGEEDMLISALEKVRGYAQNNICAGATCTTGIAHGIHFESSQYSMFQGDVYNPNDSQNESVLLNPRITLSGPTDIVFSSLSGNAHTIPIGMWDIVLTDPEHGATITLNQEGRITSHR